MREFSSRNGAISVSGLLPIKIRRLVPFLLLPPLFLVSGCMQASHQADASAAAVAAKIAPSLTSAAAQLESGMNPSTFAHGAVRADAEGRLQVYVYVNQLTPDVLTELVTNGLEEAASSPALRLAQGWVDPRNLYGLAILSFVIRITPPQYARVR